MSCLATEEEGMKNLAAVVKGMLQEMPRGIDTLERGMQRGIPALERGTRQTAVATGRTGLMAMESLALHA